MRACRGQPPADGGRDVARDPRFANNPALQAAGIRFYAGAPFGNAEGHVFGSLCILYTSPHSISERELRRLGTLADELISLLRVDTGHPPANGAGVAVPKSPDDDRPSGTSTQPVPTLAA